MSTWFFIYYFFLPISISNNKNGLIFYFYFYLGRLVTFENSAVGIGQAEWRLAHLSPVMPWWTGLGRRAQRMLAAPEAPRQPFQAADSPTPCSRNVRTAHSPTAAEPPQSVTGLPWRQPCIWSTNSDHLSAPWPAQWSHCRLTSWFRERGWN